MLKNLLTSVCVVSLVAVSQILVAQDHTIGAGYRMQEKEDSTDKLFEEMEKMQLRLREMVVELEQKLSFDPEEVAKENEEAHEAFDKQFADIGKAIEEQEEEIDALGDANKGFIIPGIGEARKVKFFGRVHLDYWAFPDADEEIIQFEGGDPQDRFNFRRLRIGTSGNLTSNVFYKYEGEFAGGVDPSYRDAYIGVKDLPFLNTLIIGNHKRPYGLDHLNSSRTNIFIERPFIVEAFNEDARRLGISSNYLSKDQKINARYGVWNRRLTQTSDGFTGDHYQLEVAGRLASTPWYDESSGGRGYLHLAVSGSVGTPDGRGGEDNELRFRTRPEARSDNRWLDTGRIAGADVASLIGLEGALNLGPWHFNAEYLHSNVERSGDFGGDSLQFHGGYFQLAYMLTGEHQSWQRKTGTIGRVKPFENFFAVRDKNSNVQRGLGAWQIAARYSYADLTDQDIVGGRGTSLTLGLNWWWTPHTRWQFNYINGEIDDSDIGIGNYDIFGMRFMVDF